jgi:hypothetical protein
MIKICNDKINYKNINNICTQKLNKTRVKHDAYKSKYDIFYRTKEVDVTKERCSMRNVMTQDVTSHP